MEIIIIALFCRLDEQIFVKSLAHYMLLNIRGFVFSESEGFEDMERSNSLA